MLLERNKSALTRHPGLEPGSRFLAGEKAGPRVKPGVTVKNGPHPPILPV